MKTMKNKSKLNQIRQANNKASIPQEWLYMNEQPLTVRDIREVFDTQAELEIEIWEEAGVLEVLVPDGKSLEFEATQTELGDEYSNSFLAENHITSLFFVTVDTQQEAKMQELMKKLVEKKGGFFCGDTEDFQPMIGK